MLLCDQVHEGRRQRQAKKLQDEDCEWTPSAARRQNGKANAGKRKAARAGNCEGKKRGDAAAEESGKATASKGRKRRNCRQDEAKMKEVSKDDLSLAPSWTLYSVDLTAFQTWMQSLEALCQWI